MARADVPIAVDNTLSGEDVSCGNEIFDQRRVDWACRSGLGACSAHVGVEGAAGQREADGKKAAAYGDGIT